MSLRRWAVKPGELKKLSREELLLFAARCCLRTAPWVPQKLGARWRSGLRALLDAASLPPKQRHDLHELSRALGDAGAIECNRRDGTPHEALGRCINFAFNALTEALEACTLEERTALVKQVIDVAKLAASIPAVWAHDGKVKAKGNAVDVACTAVWNATRNDLRAVVGTSFVGVKPSQKLKALEGLGPLWKGATPAWFSPG